MILASTYFFFNNIIYKQVFGTPMSSPLSSIIADMIPQKLEKFALKNLSINIFIYFRYVVDYRLYT